MNVGGLNSYNTDQTWSSGLSGSGSGGSFAEATTGAFDGDKTTRARWTGTADPVLTATLPSAISATKLRIKGHFWDSTTGANEDVLVSVNGGPYVFPTEAGFISYAELIAAGNNPTLDISSLITNGQVSSVSVKRRGSTSTATGLTIYFIEVDGKILVDNNQTPPNVPSIAPIGCSVGTKQGFSIIQYQAPTEGDVVPHGLSQKPSFMIIKNMDASGDWFVYHHKANSGADMTSSQGLNLNNTGALFSSGSNTFITDKDSSTFTVGSSSIVRSGTNDFIAYIWHDVPGLQKFGTYINPSSTEGGFVELGFKPAVLIFKCAVNISSSSGAGDWIIKDTTRSPINNPSDGNTLVLNVTNDEDGYYTASQAAVDILSNGFKIRHNNSSPGGDPGRLYVYAAWAEAPSINLYGGQSNAR